MDIFAGSFKFVLNSEDSHDLDLPLDRLRAKGGTMVMWDIKLDQVIIVIKPVSPSILPLLVKIPGAAPACHIGVYLPTAGLEEQFIDALSELDIAITDIAERLGDDLPIFIRGDMNISKKNQVRAPLLSHLKSKFSLLSVPLQHPSYHILLGRVNLIPNWMFFSIPTCRVYQRPSFIKFANMNTPLCVVTMTYFSPG